MVLGLIAHGNSVRSVLRHPGTSPGIHGALVVCGRGCRASMPKDTIGGRPPDDELLHGCGHPAGCAPAHRFGLTGGLLLISHAYATCNYVFVWSFSVGARSHSSSAGIYSFFLRTGNPSSGFDGVAALEFVVDPIVYCPVVSRVISLSISYVCLFMLWVIFCLVHVECINF